MDFYRVHSLVNTTELLLAILQQVDHPKTLARCARVCRLWYNLSIPVLWRGQNDHRSLWTDIARLQSPWLTPDVEHLVNLAKSPDRFRHYVSFIDTLFLQHRGAASQGWHEQDEDAKILFQSDHSLWSTFTGSTIVVNLEANTVFLDPMRVLVHPALKSFFLHCGVFSNAFLQHINDTCSLRLLEVWQPGFGYTNTVGVQALRHCINRHPLEHLALHGFEGLIGQSVNGPTLRSPDIGDISSTLRSLHLNMYCPVIEHLFPDLPNLESFRADIDDDDDNAWDIGRQLLRPITVCSQLRELFVVYRDPHACFQVEDFLYFAQNCPLIDTININKLSYMLNLPEFRPVTVPSNEFFAAVSLWPNLRSLIFQADLEPIMHAGILSIAKCCPKLVHLHLYGPITTDAFDGRGISFPMLKTVSFKGMLCDSVVYSPEQRVALIETLRVAMLMSMPSMRTIIPRTFNTYSNVGDSGYVGPLLPYEVTPTEPMPMREQIQLRIMERRL